MKAPAFQFYPSDFLSDGNQLVMELDEVGAYIRLLCVCWIEGHLPNDPRKLAKMAGTSLREFSRVWPAIAPCFEQDPDSEAFLVHPRLQRERAKQNDRREKARFAGRKSAEIRHSASTDVERTLNERATLQSSVFSLQSSSNNKHLLAVRGAKRPRREYSEDFEAAWKAYPKRAGGNSKPDAWAAWAARLKEGVEPAALLAGVQRYAAFVQSTGKAGTEFVLQASTFFGPTERWVDEYSAPVAAVPQKAGWERAKEDAEQAALRAVVERHRGLAPEIRERPTTTTSAQPGNVQIPPSLLGGHSA